MFTRWLFIWATGRSGSTTILEMLNSVPCVGLSGENGDFMKKLMSLDKTTRFINGKKGAWFNKVDLDKLMVIEQNWISSLNSANTIISGFKEIRIESIPYITHLFPDAFHIINYRRNHTLQLASQFQTKNSDRGLFRKEEIIRKYLKNQTNVLELPLEDFTVQKFNEVLSWIGITKYVFTTVLHSNNGGYDSDKNHTCSSQ